MSEFIIKLVVVLVGFCIAWLCEWAKESESKAAAKKALEDQKRTIYWQKKSEQTSNDDIYFSN